MAEGAPNLGRDIALRFITGCPDVESGDLVLTRVCGEQRLSALYELELDLHCTIEGGLCPDMVVDLLRRPCAVSLGPYAPPITGVLAALTMTTAPRDGESTYRAVMVPLLHYLTRSRRARVFQAMTVPRIVQTVLEAHGLSAGDHFTIRCDAPHPEREYVVQYEETDFAFISRLMEHAGIFYFFEPGPAGDRLIVTDSNRELVAADGLDALTYAVRGDAPLDTASIGALQRTDRVLPRHVLLRDYNWRSPLTVASGLADVDEENGRGLWYRYGEHFKDDAEGARLAEIRAEARRAEQTVYTANTSVVGLRPGHHFALSGAPVGELDIEYLVTAVRHDARFDGVGTYRAALTMIPRTTQYRPPLVTPRPRIDGVMHARIDGSAAGSAAPIDEQGRYQVLLPFDLAAKPGGNASRWIRMCQASAGAGYGTHFPLHIGTEVMIAHVGGDPDRPVIVGAVPNPATGAFIHAGRATRSAIRTRSGIVIDFEDDA